MPRPRPRAALAEALNAINGVVHSTLDFDDIMQRALDQGVTALGADAGTIELREEDAVGRGLPVRPLRRGGRDCVSAPSRRRSRPEAGRAGALRDRRPGTLSRTMNVGFPRAHGLRAVDRRALIVRKDVIGCLLFLDVSRGRFGDRDRLRPQAQLDRLAGRRQCTPLPRPAAHRQTLQENFIHPLPTVAGLELGWSPRRPSSPSSWAATSATCSCSTTATSWC